MASASARTRTPASVPFVAWSELRRELGGAWDEGQHVSVIAQTGGGKSFLMRHGLMPLCSADRVAVIDCKGDDPTWRGFGERVARIPRYQLFRDDERPEHYRIVTPDDVNDARGQVTDLLRSAYRAGRWIVVLDETRALADPRAPSLGLQPYLDQMWLRGRSRKVTVVAGTQAPRWVPRAMYDQASHLFIGRILDREARKRLREIAGFSDAIEPTVAALGKFDFLYIGDYGDRLAVTRVTR
jgi:hypothetical protein